MKTIKEISKEFAIKMNVANIYESEDPFYVHYSSVSGFFGDKDNDYFMVVFIETIRLKRIKVETTTDNPKKIAKIIKEIEPKAKVTYYQTETIQKELTI